MRAISFIDLVATCSSVALLDYLTSFNYVKIAKTQHLTNTKLYKQFAQERYFIK